MDDLIFIEKFISSSLYGGNEFFFFAFKSNGECVCTRIYKIEI